MAMRKRTPHALTQAPKNTEAAVDIAFYRTVREIFVEARQFVHTTANFAMANWPHTVWRVLLKPLHQIY